MQNHQLIPIVVEKKRDHKGSDVAEIALEAAESKSNASSTAEKEKTAAPLRLITFDSTDPEFDEDSDPDADLDL